MKKGRWPRLWKVVRSTLCLLAASAKSESDFSLIQNLTGEMRTSMAAEKADDTLFIRSNHELAEVWEFDLEGK